MRNALRPSDLVMGAPSFVSVDVETANGQRDSLCALSLVRVDGGRITRSLSALVKYDGHFAARNTAIHGIRAEHVRGCPPLPAVLMGLAVFFAGAGFITAFNSQFDRDVLEKSAGVYAGLLPNLPWECGLKLARLTWPNLPNHRLPTVCDRIGAPLQHHDPLSDAQANARVVLAARAHELQTGFASATGSIQ